MNPTIAEIEALRADLIHYRGGVDSRDRLIALCDFRLAHERGDTDYMRAHRSTASYAAADSDGPSQEGAGAPAGTTLSADDAELCLHLRVGRTEAHCHEAAARIEALSAEVASYKNVASTILSVEGQNARNAEARAEAAERAREACEWIVNDARYKAPEQIGWVAERWLDRIDAALAAAPAEKPDA